MTALQTIARLSQSVTLAGVILSSAAMMQPAVIDRLNQTLVGQTLVEAAAPQSAQAAQPTPPDNGRPSRTQGTGTR
ncbi:MAG TPA: hypothetical protein V6D46_00735 [Coleofasciculaceae cyanobacterium]